MRAGDHAQELALILNTQGNWPARRTATLPGRNGTTARPWRWRRRAGRRRSPPIWRTSGRSSCAGAMRTEALRLHREGLELRVALGHRRGFAICLEYFGALAIIFGRYPQAARFYGASEALREELNSPRNSDPADDAEHRALPRYRWGAGRPRDLGRRLGRGPRPPPRTGDRRGPGDGATVRGQLRNAGVFVRGWLKPPAFHLP